MNPRKPTEEEKEELLNYDIAEYKEWCRARGRKVEKETIQEIRESLATTAIAVFDNFQGIYGYSGKTMVTLHGLVENPFVYIWEDGKMREVELLK